MLTGHVASLTEDKDQIQQRAAVAERKASVEGKERASRMGDLEKDLVAARAEARAAEKRSKVASASVREERTSKKDEMYEPTLVSLVLALRGTRTCIPGPNLSILY